MKTKCVRFPRLAKCPGLIYEHDASCQNRLNALENAGWDFGFQENEIHDLIMQFGEPETPEDGGWILPDGTILDFRRSDRSNGAIRHSAIFHGLSQRKKDALLKFQDERQLTYSDDSIAIDACMASGIIRYHISLDPSYFVTYFSVERRPTEAQIRTIRHICEFIKEKSETTLAGKNFTGIYECGGMHEICDDPIVFSRELVLSASSMPDSIA